MIYELFERTDINGTTNIHFVRMSDNYFHFYAFDKKPLTINGEELYRAYDYKLLIDMDTAIAEGFSYDVTFGAKDDTCYLITGDMMDELLDNWDSFPIDEANAMASEELEEWDLCNKSGRSSEYLLIDTQMTKNCILFVTQIQTCTPM